MSDSFWNGLRALSFSTEADVEVQLVLPLLTALGFGQGEIAAKPPLKCVSTKGRKPEADFVVFAGGLQTKDSSLITVEVKKPGEDLDGAKLQAEFYAAWFRTPFLLSTNGERLEIWQMQISRESSCVLSSAVDQLDRGQVEYVLSRSGVLAHCDTLQIKVIKLDDLELDDFIEAQSERLMRILPPHALERYVRGPLPSEASVVSAGDLLDLCKPGALVQGGAGVGKTTLALQLSGLALERLQADVPNARLPVHVFLPDVAALAQDLLAYVYDRVAAHIPSLVSFATFASLVLRKGRLLLLLDGYDRLSEESRATVQASLRAFEADFPSCQFVLFGRTGSNLDPHIPKFKLSRFSEVEVDSFLDCAYLVDAQAVGHLATRMRRNAHWRQVSCWPYFANKMIEYFQLKGSLPSSVGEIMSDWLDTILLAATRSNTKSFCLRKGLVEISKELATGVVDVPKAASLVRDDDGCVYLDRLIDAGILVRQGSVVELEHELLGSYLLATAIGVSDDVGFMRAFFSTVGTKRHEGILLFMQEELTTWPLQSVFWSALCDTSLVAYHRCLKHGSPIWPRDTSRRGKEMFLAEVLKGRNEIATRWFDPLYDDEWAAVGIVGFVPDDYSEVRFHFQRSAAPVQLTSPEGATTGNCYFYLLGGPYVTVSGPREIGVKVFLRDLKKRIAVGDLRGGVVWTQERVTHAIYELGGDDSRPIAELLEELRSGHLFAPDEVQGDLETLVSSGFSRANDWALPPSDLSPDPNWNMWLWTDLYSDNQLVEYVRVLFERVHAAYREVATCSFPKLVGEVGLGRDLIHDVHVEIDRDACNPGRRVILRKKWSVCKDGAEGGVKAFIRGRQSFGDLDNCEFTKDWGWEALSRNVYDENRTEVQVRACEMLTEFISRALDFDSHWA